MDSFNWVFVISVFPINLFLLLPLDFPGSGLLCGTCQVVSLSVRIQDSALLFLPPMCTLPRELYITVERDLTRLPAPWAYLLL